MNDTTTNQAKEQARAQLDSVIAMIERLNHVQTCDGDDCKLTDQEIFAGIGYIGDKLEDQYIEEYHDEDAARQAIEEDPLSVEVRSNWHSPGSEILDDFSIDADAIPYTEYKILLCTGGPAVRITGTLSQHSQPDSAVIEYQDWGTPWTELQVPRSEELTMIQYANCFYFGD